MDAADRVTPDYSDCRAGTARHRSGCQRRLLRQRRSPLASHLPPLRLRWLPSSVPEIHDRDHLPSRTRRGQRSRLPHEKTRADALAEAQVSQFNAADRLNKATAVIAGSRRRRPPAAGTGGRPGRVPRLDRRRRNLRVRRRRWQQVPQGRVSPSSMPCSPACRCRSRAGHSGRR